MNADYGLSKVCFTIFHPRVSDLKVWLLSPAGTEVWLTNRNGNNGVNFETTCFSNSGFSGTLQQADAPFSGDFVPDGRLNFFNDGQNPNGIWYLIIRDLSKNFKGRVNDFSIIFSDSKT